MRKVTLLVITLVFMLDFFIISKNPKLIDVVDVTMSSPSTDYRFSIKNAKETIMFENFEPVPPKMWKKQISFESKNLGFRKNIYLTYNYDSIKYVSVLLLTFSFFVFGITFRSMYIHKKIARLASDGDTSGAEKIKNLLLSQSTRTYLRSEVVLPGLFFVAVLVFSSIHANALFWISFAFWVVLWGILIYLTRNLLISRNRITLYSYFMD